MCLAYELDVQHAGPVQHHGKALQMPFYAPELEATKVALMDLGLLAGINLVSDGELRHVAVPAAS